MGLTRLRGSAIRSANDDRYFSMVLNLICGATTPEEIILRCEDEANRLDMKIMTKASTSLKWSKMTTTFYREIRLSQGYSDKSPWQKAATWCHEMVHVYQWRGMGRTKFASRYAWRTSRWWIEMQAYRMDIYISKMSLAKTTKIQDYIESMPSNLRSGYALGGLRQKDLRDATREVLTGELNKTRLT